jgi:hypothetical protein
VIETVWAAVNGYPTEDTASASLKKQKDEKARAIICLTLETQVKSYVVQTTTAKEAWDAWERTFTDQGVNSWKSILTDLCSLKLVDYKSMQEYVNTFMSINLRLDSREDELLAALMLKGLTKEYYPMRMALENSNVNLTSELIKSKLLQDTEFGRKCKFRFSISVQR